MKRILVTAIALTLLGSTAAMAHDYRDGDGYYGRSYEHHDRDRHEWGAYHRSAYRYDGDRRYYGRGYREYDGYRGDRHRDYDHRDYRDDD